MNTPNNNPFNVLRPSTLAAIIADIDANLQLTPSDNMIEGVREACYVALCDVWGSEEADREIARILREEF